MDTIPIIDLSSLTTSSAPSASAWTQAARDIGHACKEMGFFYVTNHGVPDKLIQDIFRYGFDFFHLPEEEKLKIKMSTGGRAIRGFFPVGGELTSGRPDHKEGIYFGTEMSWEEGKGKPMHGPNLWPEMVPELKQTVLDYMKACTDLGHLIMKAVALSLNLPPDFFLKLYTEQPFTPFRLFHYPADPQGTHDDGVVRWGVGRHTDYGVLTILAQDDCGGLQVETRKGVWIDAPPIKGSFIINIGDMLDIWTGGEYKATPHRVKNISGRDRLSIPFFFDPHFDSVIESFRPDMVNPNSPWAKPFPYGRYIYNKVCNCFPELAEENGDTFVPNSVAMRPGYA